MSQDELDAINESADQKKKKKKKKNRDIIVEIKNILKWKKNNRKPYKKPTTKPNLQDALDLAVNDLETVDYNNGTRLEDLDDLETVDYTNDT